MYMSDRAVALIYFVLGMFLPPAYFGLQQMIAPPPPNPYGIVSSFPLERLLLLMWIVFAAFMWIIAAWLYSRNRPVFGGRTETDTRGKIREWYRDAKKWMDEHPEHVDMKDL